MRKITEDSHVKLLRKAKKSAIKKKKKAKSLTWVSALPAFLSLGTLYHLYTFIHASTSLSLSVSVSQNPMLFLMDYAQ
jgi:hypothetical protein